MALCTVTNIMGARCRLGVGHDAPHDYAPAPFRVSSSAAKLVVTGLHDRLAAAEQEIALLQETLSALRAAVTKGDGAASFFLAAWKASNLTIAELRAELAKERERTAGMLGAAVSP